MPLAYYDRHQTGEIMSFVTNDVAAIQSALVDNLIDLVTEGCILIGSLVLMFYLDWKLSLLTLVVIPMVGQAMKIFGRKIKSPATSFSSASPRSRRVPAGELLRDARGEVLRTRGL